MGVIYKVSRHSSVVEHVIGNDEADGSIPSDGTTYMPGVVARFWSKVGVLCSQLGQEHCWHWRASKDRHGYGQFKPVVGAKPLRAHRVAWEIWNGRDIPDGMIVMHSCDNPGCCNPRHLSLGTHKQNAEDKMKKGRGWYGGPRRRVAA